MADSLADKITKQAALVNELRTQQPNNTTQIDEARKVLGELKKALNSSSKEKEKGSDAKKGEKMLLKTAKVSVVALDARVNSVGNPRFRTLGDVLSSPHRIYHERGLHNLWRLLSRHSSLRT